MQSPVLQGSVLISPVAGAPSAEGMFNDPRTAEVLETPPQRADVQFADLVPDEGTLVLAEGAIPAWPLVAVPMQLVLALPENSVTEVPDLETTRLAWQKAGFGLDLLVGSVLPTDNGLSAAPLVSAAAMIDAPNPATEPDTSPVSTDPGSLDAVPDLPHAAPVMARMVLPGEWTSPLLILPEVILPEGPALSDRPPGMEANPAERARTGIEPHSLARPTRDMPVAVAESPIILGFFGEAAAPRPTATIPTMAEWSEIPQQRPLATPSPRQVLPPMATDVLAAVLVPDGEANADAAVFRLVLPDTAPDTAPDTRDLSADKQVETAGAVGGPQTDKTTWPVLRPTALVLRYESEGQFGRIERLTVPGADSAVPIARTDLPKPGPGLDPKVQTNLLWQPPPLKTRNAEETVIDSELIVLAPSGSPGTVGGGLSIAALAETGRTPVANLPHLAAGIASTLAKGHDGSATLTLSPEELGRVRLTFQPDNQSPDRLIVMLNFDRPESMDLFRRHADQLAEALRTAGYSGVQIGFGWGSGGDGTHQQAGQTPAAVPGFDDQTLADGGLSTPLPRHLTSLGALDLRL